MRPVVLRARAMPVMTRAQAADAAARQQHETLGGLIAQLRQLERDVGSEAYVVYYTSRADAARLVLQGPSKFYSPYRPPRAHSGGRFEVPEKPPRRFKITGAM